MNDKELLELAAKAAGIRLEWDGDPETWAPIYYDGKTYHAFNPLTDDGDALRLAVKLDMNLLSGYKKMIAEIPSDGDVSPIVAAVEKANDPYAATRRAIVRAAAEIGRSM